MRPETHAAPRKAWVLDRVMTGEPDQQGGTFVDNAGVAGALAGGMTLATFLTGLAMVAGDYPLV